MAAESTRQQSQAPLLRLTWEDVAVRFCPAEWALLTERQRELYREVTEDTVKLAASLGLVSSKLGLRGGRAEQEEPWARDPHPGWRERGAQGNPMSAGQSRSITPKWKIKDELETHPLFWTKDTVGASGLDPRNLCPRQCEVKLTDVMSPSWGLWLEDRSLTKEERLICGECGKSFADWESLPKHQCLRWEKRGPWACSLCGKAFRYHNNLWAHKKHRGKDRQACTLCGLHFCLRGDLMRHRSSHMAEGTSHGKSHLLTHKEEPCGQKVHSQKSPNCCQAAVRRKSRIRKSHCGAGVKSAELKPKRLTLGLFQSSKVVKMSPQLTLSAKH